MAKRSQPKLGDQQHPIESPQIKRTRERRERTRKKKNRIRENKTQKEKTKNTTHQTQFPKQPSPPSRPLPASPFALSLSLGRQIASARRVWWFRLCRRSLKFETKNENESRGRTPLRARRSRPGGQKGHRRRAPPPEYRPRWEAGTGATAEREEEGSSSETVEMLRDEAFCDLAPDAETEARVREAREGVCVRGLVKREFAEAEPWSTTVRRR
ncbi:hypothetical protein C8R45DRAFT_928433 [Mycena sanguinolenta]|nr:hypothetical protein C8R45DRAFT_928433 [Mycena sanguinolenta]